MFPFFIIVARTVGPFDRSSEKNLINEAILSLKLSFPPPLPFVQNSNTNNNTGRYLFPARLSSRPAHSRKKNTRNSHHIPSIAWLHKFKFMITVNAQFPADAGLGSRPRDDGDGGWTNFAYARQSLEFSPLWPSAPGFLELLPMKNEAWNPQALKAIKCIPLTAFGSQISMPWRPQHVTSWRVRVRASTQNSKPWPSHAF